MDPGMAVLVYGLLAILGLAALFAQFRLFSIDRTLKNISDKLGATPKEPETPAKEYPPA